MKNDWEVMVEELLLYLEQLANLKSEEKKNYAHFSTQPSIPVKKAILLQ